MTAATRLHGTMFCAAKTLPKGHQLLWNRGTPVLCVPIGAPIEDAECDEIWLHPDDYEDLMRQVDAKGIA